MKKSLLLAISLGFALKGFSQVLPEDYANAPIPKGLNDTMNAYWVVKNTVETKSDKFTVDFGKIKYETSKEIYKPSTVGSSFIVDFDRSQESGENWNELYLRWAFWGENSKLTQPISNPFTHKLENGKYVSNDAQDTLIGNFIDLSTNPAIKVVAKASAKTLVTVLLMDKNGRWSQINTSRHWLSGNGFETLFFKYNAQKTDGTIDWLQSSTPDNNKDAGGAFDGWTGDWWNIPSSRYSKTLPLMGRTGLTGGVMLDLHNIVGMAFRFDDGDISTEYNLVEKKTIEIQSITLSNETKYGNAPVPVGLNDSANAFYTVTSHRLTPVSGLQVIDAKYNNLWWKFGNGLYTISSNNNALEVAFDRSKNQSPENYSDFGMNWARWGINQTSSMPRKDLSPFPYLVEGTADASIISAVSNTNQDTLYGYAVDLSENAVVKMKVRCTQPTNLRVDVIDKNGRHSNLVASHHWIRTANKDTVIEFRWDKKKLDGTPDFEFEGNSENDYDAGIAADGWMYSWWDVTIGRNDATTPLLKGRHYWNGAVLLDLKNIVGLALTIEDGQATSLLPAGANVAKTLTISEIVVGSIMSDPKQLFGKADVCALTTEEYSWNPVLGADSYVLNYTGTGATIQMHDTSATIQYSASATTGRLELQAKAGDKLSSKVGLDISVTQAPTILSIEGAAEVCQNTEHTYSLVLNGSSIVWSTTNNVTVLSGQNTNDLQVKIADTATFVKISAQLTNTCGTKPITKDVSVLKIPVLSGQLVGKDTVCNNAQGVVYSFDNSLIQSGVTYNWDFNGTKTSTTSNSQSFNFENKPASISVQAHHEYCGDSKDVLKKDIVVQSAYPEPLGIVSFSKDGKSINIAWERSKNKGTKCYSLYRAVTSTLWERVDSLPFEKPSMYVDNDVQISKLRYKYKLRTYSTCGDWAESTPHRYMLLQSSYDVGSGRVNFDWNPYEGLTVDKYTIKRIYKNGQADEVIVTPPGDETKAFDDSPVPNTSYRIEFNLGYSIDPTFLKSDSGPFSQSLSNMAEANLVSTSEIRRDEASLQPNPASDKIQITANEAIDFVKLVNQIGESVQVEFTQISDRSLELQVNNLPVGIYSVVINQSQGNKTYKFVKE